MRYKKLTKGTTVLTKDTIKWSKDQIDKNDKVEGKMIFTDFSFSDQGRSRELVCTMNENHPNFKEYRKLILYAPQLYSALKSLVSVVESLDFKNNTPVNYELGFSNILIKELDGKI